MPKYTEEERAQRHWERYGEYPPPPRRYRKQAWDGLGQAESKGECNELLWAGLGLLAGWLIWGRKEKTETILPAPERTLPASAVSEEEITEI